MQPVSGLPDSTVAKESTCSAGVLIPGWGRSPGEGKGYPFQDSGLENPWTVLPMGSQRVGHEWVTFAHSLAYLKEITEWEQNPQLRRLKKKHRVTKACGNQFLRPYTGDPKHWPSIAVPSSCCICIFWCCLNHFPLGTLFWLSVKWVKVKLLGHVWLFATPWTVAYQASPSMGFSRQESWSGVPLPSPGDLPNPGIEPGSPTLKADALRLSHQEIWLLVGGSNSSPIFYFFRSIFNHTLIRHFYVHKWYFVQHLLYQVLSVYI